MFNEKAFIAEVEAADTEKLATLLRYPTREQEEALRAHLGPERYQRMHSMALRRNITRGIAHSRGSDPDKGNVVVIHGIMGGELTVMNRKGGGDQVWVKALKIMSGWLERLQLLDDGKMEADDRYDVRATGILKRYYGELLLSLSENWNVRAFWFDWRKDLQLAATDLEAKINGWFDEGKPVHLVAHSMGGLVARTFIKKYPKRWESMYDSDGNGRLGGRLIMLGTPNYGSFAIPQTMTGVEGMVRKLALLDIRHNIAELLNILNTFVGSYQMLPSPYMMPEMEPLYNAGTYGNVKVSQAHLENAREHHEYLRDIPNPERMIYIAGYGQPTFSNIPDLTKIGSLDGYEVTPDGDGRVPHTLGILRQGGTPKGEQAGKLYFIREEHGNLSSNPTILDTLTELLETGQTEDKRFETELPKSRGAQKRGADNLRDDLLLQQKEEERLLQISLRRLRVAATPGSSRRGGAVEEDIDDVELPNDAASNQMSPEERKIEEQLTREYLGGREVRGGNGVAANTAPFDDSTSDNGSTPSSDDDKDSEDETGAGLSIEIVLEHADIDKIETSGQGIGSEMPIDAVSVGHYIGVQPQAAELALDRAISRVLAGKKYSDGKSKDIAKPDLILTMYTERGIIHGKLGQPFFMPDPRPNNSNRMVAIAGMGEPGRFGAPELTVLMRELCWALGRMGKRHLATVVIGAGVGNLPLEDAIPAFMNGIRRAVTGSQEDEDRRLRRVTIVERDPRKIRLIDKSLREEMDALSEYDLKIVYTPLKPQELEALKEKEKEAALKDLMKSWDSDNSDHKDDVPARVTLSLDANSKTYTYGAITETASVPERPIKIDPLVVNQANDELAGEEKPDMQLERGRFLEELLMPDDLRRELYGRAPLVMMLDSTTARIHWEMVAQPELVTGTGDAAAAQNAEFDSDRFLGTSRGLTRQLRTTFAPPPEPPPPPRRVLRVLIVADPAEDAHLPGAEEEAEAVAHIFESYNTVYGGGNDTRVKVMRLFGPVDATRTNVLRELMVRQYDVLHYAGHCEYNTKDPAASGWIFNMKNGERLTANELDRIDRIPKFVFSNACESGITPDRAQKRTAELAPSFAEAFFKKGVANFVCTAWPVDDLAARVFATTLYSGLLGIKEQDGTFVEATPRPMHSAMREARRTIARTEGGAATWGAYQHYGNPYFQLFNSPTGNRDDDGNDDETGTKSVARKRTRSSKAGSKKSARPASKKAGRKASKK